MDASNNSSLERTSSDYYGKHHCVGPETESSLLQSVNSSSELAGYGGKGVYGGRVQILIIEQVLEVGQGIILLAALLLQEGSATWLRSTIEALTHRFSQYIGHGTETMDIQEEPVVVFPEHAFSRSLTPGPTEVRSRQTTEQA